MSIPATTAGLQQIQDLTNLAKEFNFYARGTKQIANARAFKSQFAALKNGISTVKKTADTATTTAKKANDIASNSKKIVDLIQKGAFKDVNPKWGRALGILLNVANAGVTILSVKSQETIQGINLANEQRIEFDLQNAFTRSINNSISIRRIDKTLEDYKSKIADNKADISSIRTSLDKTRNSVNDALYETRQGRKIVEEKIEAAKKQANDALYETRQGRKIVEEKIEAAKKQANDALYETRQGRKIVEDRINSVSNTLTTTFQSKITSLIEPLRSTLTSNKAEIEALKSRISQPAKTLDPQAITKQAVDASLSALGSRLVQINQENYGQNLKIDTIANGLTALGTQLRTTNNRVDILERTPLKIPPQKNYDAQIDQINTKLREQDRVNQEGLTKINSLLTLIPAIPARTAGLITPSIPTIPQIETAAATGTCRTTQPGGCSRKMIDDAVNNINQNANNKANNILNAVNATANGAELALLGVINTKLGDQLPGGLSGKLTRLSKWLHLDRALNILIWWQTLHNAYMLSANLGQTLTGAISNVLAAIGIKDAEGSPLNIGEILGNQFDSLAKSVLGEKEWGSIKTEYKKWNRIYQATANLLNSIQSISASILNALEVVGQWNAKVANALKRFGVVGEKAYEWFNPNVNFQNKYFTALENATNVISQVDQVASEVLSIKETVDQIKGQKKELDDSLKEKDNSNQKSSLPEAEKLASKESQSKLVSAAFDLTDIDLTADED